jgi:hypothetical protein
MFTIHAKAHAVRVLPVVVAVAVTKQAGLIMRMRYFQHLLVMLLCMTYASLANALVLPEDRADVLFHSYDGGGAEISGPSILVRKKFSENVSASYNNYVDNVSSASIDVMTTASKYTEKRIENSISLDYLNDKTLMSTSFTNSSESDYEADTFSLNISQDVFGDLTTVSMGYSQGDNTVKSNSDAGFKEDTQTRSYRLSLTQVMTQDLIVSFALEGITDEGYLNNPYRSVRYLDSSVPVGYSYQKEAYPNTRTSSAVAVRARYYLSQRAALHGGYRYYSDDWGIEANTYDLGYTWPYNEEWLLEFSFRYYDQTHADFYSDLFPYISAQNFLARDKELSTYNDHSVGAGATFEFEKNGSGFIKRGTANVFLDYISFNYDDFRDLSKSANPGEEPLYKMDATVLRLFVSIWF